MCTIEERYNNARSLMDQKKFKDAADEFELLAQETNNIQAAFASAKASNLMARLYIEMGNNNGAITYADRAISWTAKLSYEEDVMKEYEKDVYGIYAAAQSLKGQALFYEDYQSEACIEPLQEADEFGDNVARGYLGKWYTLNAADPGDDWNAFIDSCSKQAYWLEKYMDNLEGGEDEEEIGYICSVLASLYEEGLGVKKDRNKARYYRNR